MSTRSMIGKKMADGTIKAIYAYLFDGAWKVAPVSFFETVELQFKDLAQVLAEREEEAKNA